MQEYDRRHARERAAREFPQFWVHTHPDPVWSERTDPSEEALSVEGKVLDAVAAAGRQFDVRIVWLREPPTTLEQHIEEEGAVFDPGEAILVRPFLGRYALVLPLDWPRTEAEDA